MNAAWQWIEAPVALAIHEEQLIQHGGQSGVRDHGLLDSLARPQQLAAYGDLDAFDLAAAYAFGIARNHRFFDGNKRTAWVVARLFLLLHGFDRGASDEHCYLAMLSLAAGESSQGQFAEWLRSHSRRVRG